MADVATWARRAYEFATRPVFAILDVGVVAVVWWVLGSSYSHWVKGLVIVPVLVVGASSFLALNHWWRPQPKCESRGCPNRAGGQTCATMDEHGKHRDRRVCDAHWNVWRRPGVGRDGAEARDEMMRAWGWPGSAWWRD